MDKINNISIVYCRNQLINLSMLKQTRSAYSTSNNPKISDLQQDPEKQDFLAKSQINLNAEIIRIQTLTCAKQIEQIYDLDVNNTLKFFGSRYVALPLSRSPPADLYGKQGVRIIKTDNKIYLGEVVNKKKHGKGIIIYKQGRIYEGNFYQNQKDGFGCQLYSNGNLYIGEFSQNKKHGKGSFYWFNLCASACIKEAGINIQQYHGTWWGGLPDGQGEHTKSNGDYYTGKFKNGLKHGEGTQNFANGDVYKGEYLNGLPEGYGHYVWSDKSEYKGDFKQGYRNGYGIWIDEKKKLKYQGHYLLDRKHGYGVFSWQNLNQQYHGHYIQDMRTGQGQLYNKGKLVYKGLWQNGKQIESFEPISQFTPPKTTKYPRKTDNFLTNSQFRVKTKVKFSSMGRNSEASAVKTRKSQYQVNFVHHTSERKCRRGCVACQKRPIPGQYSQKNLTPEKYTSYK